MSKRPAECVCPESEARCSKLPTVGESAPSLDTVEQMFSALQHSDSQLITQNPALPPNAVVKFRTQFNTVREGGLVEYAVYRVFEEAKLSGRNATVCAAHRALEALLKVHCPKSLTVELVPFLAGDAYRMAFGKDARLEDVHIAACLRVFLVAKNQAPTTETLRTLLLLLMRENLVISTTTVLQHGADVLTEGDKYFLLREGVIISRGVDWLTLVPGYLWPESQRIPEGFRSADSDETLLDVWVDHSRMLSKLVVLLQTQKPTAAIKERYNRACASIFRRRLDEMAVGEASVYLGCTQCHMLLEFALTKAAGAEMK